VLRPIISFLLLLGALQGITYLAAQEIPHLDHSQGSAQLILGGQPFIIFGGELSNSATGTAAHADDIKVIRIFVYFPLHSIEREVSHYLASRLTPVVGLLALCANDC